MISSSFVPIPILYTPFDPIVAVRRDHLPSLQQCQGIGSSEASFSLHNIPSCIGSMYLQCFNTDYPALSMAYHQSKAQIQEIVTMLISRQTHPSGLPYILTDRNK